MREMRDEAEREWTDRILISSILLRILTCLFFYPSTIRSTYIIPVPCIVECGSILLSPHRPHSYEYVAPKRLNGGPRHSSSVFPRVIRWRRAMILSKSTPYMKCRFKYTTWSLIVWASYRIFNTLVLVCSPHCTILPYEYAERSRREIRITLRHGEVWLINHLQLLM